MLVCREKGKMESSDLAIEAWLAEFRCYSKLHIWFWQFYYSSPHYSGNLC